MSEPPRNDHLIAAAEKSRLYEESNTIADRREGLMQKLSDSSVHYNEFDGRKFRMPGVCGARGARTLIDRGMKKFEKQTC